ncbi:putative ABC transporter ATP-binding protein YxlF [Polystyrenella longa]|uniref:Putative ABC transporter ATP-binding protein YxlF n=1 Tax=Polystyrenella longa TaxID=2528007 RepID=A0A518CK02_9PLAN|nr:ATP-binding cassette domain-containing protein [Polystyrenella longa]QDU79537.1 putative ABC transporter ATP-binding protein YxlF [Polystyrenella longa]
MENSTAKPVAKTNGAAVIESRGLSKYYGPFIATEDVTFSVSQGEIVAFLGPNGAGKSTTMKMLTGFLAPSKGESRIAGHLMQEQEERILASQKIGYLPENGPLYNEMTPASFLKYMGSARNLSGSKLQERLDYVCEQCSLNTVWNKAISKLSRGYRQRVGMAHALLHDPEVLILDEPTSGLDPNQVHEVRTLIRNLGKSKTLLLSTHILSEVEAVCDRVLLISSGRLVFDGSVSEMAGTENNLEDRFRELTGNCKV